MEEDYCNYGVNDHVEEHELTIDNNKRINIGKKILVNEVGWDEDDSIFVIAKKNGEEFFLIKTTDLKWELGDDEILIGEYQLKNGALRIGISSFINNVEAGNVMYCKTHFPVMCTDDNMLYVHVYFK